MRSLLSLAVLLPLVTTPARAETPVVTEEAGPPPSKKLAIGLGVGAVAAFAVGGGLGGTALSLQGEQQGSVASPPVYTQMLSDHARTGNNLAIGAYACYGAGAALALVDVVVLIEMARHRHGTQK